MPPDPRPGFYPRWIVANGWAEALGLGTTLLLGRVAAPLLDQNAGWTAILPGAAAAVLLGILLEGALVGFAQARVIGASLAAVSAAAWTKATMVGAGAAWLLGTVPSTVVALLASEPVAGAPPPAEPAAVVQYGLALLLGAVTGPVLGVGQWLVLRRHVARAGRWIGANALAWAVGMAWIFIGMDRLPWAHGGYLLGLGVYGVCGAAGLLVGTIHGPVLQGLLRAAGEQAPGQEN